jgi:nucleotidyltransferase AbiEii toxin of type IV toxin-antitoxin system
MPELTLAEKISALERVLGASEVPFAFGGALALAYYAEPRATVDIDVNIFAPPDAVDQVADVLATTDIRTSAADRRTILSDGQVRLHWGVTPIDLFFAYDPFHFHAAGRVRRVPFGNEAIHILAPEDLMVCKVVFNRRKDWLDIEQMLLLTAGTLDVDDVRRWIVKIVGDDDERIRHFERTVQEVLGDQ